MSRLGPRFLLAAGFSLLLALPGHAYTQLYRFQYCASLPDEVDRLYCYDNYAREMGLSPADSAGSISASQRTVGKWTIRGESTAKTSSVFVFTEGTSRYTHSSHMVVPTLVARCSDNTTDLFVYFGSYFPVQVGPQEQSALYTKYPQKEGGTDGRVVKIRFDAGEEMELEARENAAGTAFFFPNPVSYLRRLRSSGSLSFSHSAPNHPGIDTTFSLEGMTEALAPLRKHCEW